MHIIRCNIGERFQYEAVSKHIGAWQPDGLCSNGRAIQEEIDVEGPRRKTFLAALSTRKFMHCLNELDDLFDSPPRVTANNEIQEIVTVKSNGFVPVNR